MVDWPWGSFIDVEQFLSATGRDPNEFVENFRPQAEEAVKVDLALRAVATAEGLEVSEDDIEAEYQHLSLHINQKPKQIRNERLVQRLGEATARLFSPML